MQKVFSIKLPKELAASLHAASAESNCPPATFLHELVESALAERRLPGVRQAKLGARVPGETILDVL
jgi:hypothetical protein